MKRTACLILILLAYLPGQALPQQSVYFADSNLKTAVEEALGTAANDIDLKMKELGWPDLKGY